MMLRSHPLTTLPLTATLFLSVLLSGCAGSTPPPDAASHTCPDGFFWNGTECEKRRSIVIEQGQPKPTSTATSEPAPPK